MDDEVYSDMLIMLSAEIGGANPTLHTSHSIIPRGEVFPTNIAPVMARGGNNVGEGLANASVLGCKWGFPHWKGAGVIINARAETAVEKKMFRKPLFERRCVVPSSGFYEWDHASGKKKKDKYLLRIPGERALFMAGMIDSFKDADGSEYSAFVILTTAANASVAPIHDRMPVILAPEERSLWLGDDAFMEHALHRTGPPLDPVACGA